LLSAQLGADLGDELIEALTNAWPQSSGRDIKELLKLTTRYCRAKEIPLSEDAFRICATFRGHA
ncbi:AAA family ATPase, partial [Paraburkholderia sp. SIMBA_050]